MNTVWGYYQGLGVAIGGAIALGCNCAVAQITTDATLPHNSRVTTHDNMRIIEGGTQAGSTLFHSFKEFSVPTGSTAYFQNAADIQNIISRVTGSSISHIDGILQTNGSANLFLINPNGIIFGPNAALKIGGSFVASTASSLNFADGFKFSATDTHTPLLTVNVPIGLQFGATAAPIRNQSQASPDGATNIFLRPVGLQVQPGKTLALVGGDVTLEGGNLTVASGRIELGSVAGNSLVSLNPTNQAWVLGYSGVQNFQNIQIIPRTVNGSDIPSIVDGSGTDGGSSIQVQGKSVEVIGNFVSLISQSRGVPDGGDLTITTGKLIVRDGAQVLTSTLDKGAAGNLTVNASESVDLIGSFFVPMINNFISSLLGTTSFAAGKAGNITINTGRLRIQDGARITAESSGQMIPNSQLIIPATGTAGNLTVNAKESIELIGTTATGVPSGLFALTSGSGSAGSLKLTTGKLIVRDGAEMTVSSQAENAQNLGKAGELNVTARNVLLFNQGKITSETDTGQGGNITLQVQDLLLLRNNSQISSSAGKVQALGNGGNIFINVPNGFIIAGSKENSDITANAFTGSGGKVQINATGIFGILPRSREDLVRLLGTNDPTQLDPQKLPTSDITAISQANPILNGLVNINTPDVDPNRGLIKLPSQPIESKVASGCQASTDQNQSQFIITGRGGLPPNPREFLRSNSVQVDWVSLDGGGRGGRGDEGVISSPSSIVEAQGWVVDAHGNITLVAQASSNPHSSWFSPAFCLLRTTEAQRTQRKR